LLDTGHVRCCLFVLAARFAIAIVVVVVAAVILLPLLLLLLLLPLLHVCMGVGSGLLHSLLLRLLCLLPV
jgi:hypothetical protein